MGVLRWRHDLRSEAGQQQQRNANAERNSHNHTLPKLLSQVSKDNSNASPAVAQGTDIEEGSSVYTGKQGHERASEPTNKVIPVFLD
ncbi:hypothetical protein TSAR_008279 [Trichomalopsis sarcophagae]|uniref:Uncharacterized protein n=1 Tax=Trichomalopsis sarcophagae TaxID=543379 RepID=A0A232FMT8_9HYME|nr:hypothetical protein TSAR_008279 [Trichomalopsis sarcophagae]